MAKLKNPKKADLNKDGKINSYEEKRGLAIEKSMAKQNRVKLKNGGFIAKGCGQVMNNRRKVTTTSQENKMFKRTKMYAAGGPVSKGTKYMSKGGVAKGTKYMSKGGVAKGTKYMSKGGVAKGTKYMAKGGKV